MAWKGFWSRRPVGPDVEDAGEYVRGLQRDGRLLLRVVVRRPDRPLGVVRPIPNTSGDTMVASYGILTDSDRQGIADDPMKLAALAECVDDLSRRVAPASAASIRLSCAYLRIPLEDGEPYPQTVRKRAFWMRISMKLMMVTAVVVTLVSVLLLAHVDNGQRTVRQLEAARGEIAAIYADLAKLAPTAWEPGANLNSVPYCEVGSIFQGSPPGEGPKARAASASPEGAQAIALCSSLGEAVLRSELIFFRLSAWNCRTYRAYSFWGLRTWLMRRWDQWLWNTPPPESPERTLCGQLPPPPPAHNSEALGHWQRTEIRTSGAISVLTGFVLPLLLACIGGCAYALRRLDQKLSQWALEFNDGSHSWLRVLLATMLGGLLGVIWTSDAPVNLGGFTLSLAAAAFFLGYSLEVVFSMIEAMVDGVAGKLRAPAPPSLVQTPAAQMVAPPRTDPAPRTDPPARHQPPAPPPPRTPSAAAPREGAPPLGAS